jgi:urea ABC transporter permease protein UrtC
MNKLHIKVNQGEGRHEFEFTYGSRSVTSTHLFFGLSGAFLLLAPLGVGSFYVGLLTRALILGIFAISVNIIWGYTGVLTFGHAFFFGVSGYIMAKLLTWGGFAGTGYLAIVLGVVVTGLTGLAIGGVLFYRNISGAFFAIITLAITVVAAQITAAWRSVTGGYNGITAIPPIQIGVPGIATASVYGGIEFYYISVVCLGVALLFARRLIRSPFGKVLSAIRENEGKARALGYKTKQYKTLAFGISGALAGFAGGIFVAYTHFVGPSLIGFLLSTEVLFWVLIGGRATLTGPVIGAVFTRVMEDTISGVLPFSWVLVVGVIFVLIVLLLPQGIVGAAKQQLYRYVGVRDKVTTGRVLDDD